MINNLNFNWTYPRNAVPLSIAFTKYCYKYLDEKIAQQKTLKTVFSNVDAGNIIK